MEQQRGKTSKAGPRFFGLFVRLFHDVFYVSPKEAAVTWQRAVKSARPCADTRSCLTGLTGS